MLQSICCTEEGKGTPRSVDSSFLPLPKPSRRFAVLVSVLLVLSMKTSPALAESMSARDIAIVCGGVQSLEVQGDGASISSDGKDYKISNADGKIAISEGGTLLAKIEGATQSEYNKCVIELRKV